MKLATAEQMKNLDRTAIDRYGIPGVVLMENAGRETFQLIERYFSPVRGKLIPIFIGPGNNGGDGLVVARCVHQNGGLPYLVYLADPDRFKGDAAVHCKTVSKLDFPSTVALDTAKLHQAVRSLLELQKTHPIHVLVDSLFGTGLKRPLQGLFLDAVRSINKLGAELHVPVTAVDIPSGLDADTGKILGGCVRADLTATYGLAKPGHFMHGGNNLVGDLHVVDIGIPQTAVASAKLSGEALGPDILQTIPERGTSTHKGNFGHLLVLAGSTGKTGAALLTGLGALRIGTGLVTLGVPCDLNTVFESSLAEAMTMPLPCSTSYLSVDDYDVIIEQSKNKIAVVVGPGLGTAPETGALVTKLYRELHMPLVVDADALNLLAIKPELLADPPATRLLTPHPGEMARLTGLNTKEIQADRLGTVQTFLKTVNRSSTNVTLLLKGAGTIICDPEGTWAVNTTGNPGMATGGMGDVLSGLVGGLMAQGLGVAAAARIGAYIHGLAADKLAKSAPFGYLASEVADIVPAVYAEHIS